MPFNNVVVLGRVIPWLGPAFTTGGWFWAESQGTVTRLDAAAIPEMEAVAWTVSISALNWV